MIVISDTSPLNYLLQIGYVEVLPKLFTQVILPREVHAELAAQHAPNLVRNWAIHPPAWLEVLAVLSAPLPGLETLDAGETAAITLAVELGASRILIDESKARRIAENRFGLTVTGTLAVLIEGHRAGFLDAHTAFETLLGTTNFYCTPQLKERFLLALSRTGDQSQ